MRRRILKVVVWIALMLVGCIAAIAGAGLILAQETPIPTHIDYGVTFSKFRTDELKLDWKATYDAIIDDLKVRRLRLIAHWPMVEPERGVFDFSVLDYQMARAEAVHASVTLAVGLRLPSWPECHMPDWARSLTPAERDAEFFKYVGAVVDRYKDSPALARWQVENELFIIGFALEQCGITDNGFADIEVGFVGARDPAHPILVTDSGELSPWYQAWRLGDVFGTTLYRYMWNPWLGEFTYPLPAWFYRARLTLMPLVTGIHKPAILAELEAEPWLLGPIVNAPLSLQLSRMSLTKFDSILSFAAQTGLDEQYLWGAEWWYYLKVKQGHPEFWDRAKELFKP